MKKILLAVLIVAGIAATSRAQTSDNTEGGHFSIGLNAGLPLGDASDLYSVGLGADLKYELPVAANTFVSVSGGYTNFLYKSSIKDYTGKSGESFIPAKFGVKYYFNGNFYGEGQIGATFATDENGTTLFTYAPGFGYTFNGGFDLGLRFEGWSHDGSLDQLALCAAYRF